MHVFLQPLWMKTGHFATIISLTLKDKSFLFSFQDEILAENDKFVMKISDLLNWVVDNETGLTEWKVGTKGVVLQNDAKGENQPPIDHIDQELWAANNAGLKLQDIKKEQKMLSKSLKYNLILLW